MRFYKLPIQPFTNESERMKNDPESVWNVHDWLYSGSDINSIKKLFYLYIIP